MNPQLFIAPSILSADWCKLAEEVESVERAGADWLHLDVMDGHFVPPISFGADLVKAVRKTTKLTLDVHLMIENPEKQIQLFADAGADRITVHQEACPHLHRVLDMIQKAGLKAGVAINPGTACATLESILSTADLVLVMTINPGWGGQKLIESTIEKIRAVRLMIAQSRRDILLEVDGGIDPVTAKRVIAAGAEVLVAGTAVFHAGQRTETDYRTAIDSLRAAMPGSKTIGIRAVP